MVQIAAPIGANGSGKLRSNGNGHDIKHRQQPFDLQAPPSSAFYKTMTRVAAGVVLMQVGFLAFEEVLRREAVLSLLGFKPASSETCRSQRPDNEKCGRPDLFAFQMVSLVVFLIVGGLGVYLWHVATPATTTTTTTNGSDSVHRFTTPSTRLYGYQTQAEWLTIVNLAYQVWDFAISLTIPEHCTAIMLVHHVVAATVSFSAVYNHMLGYYAVFFLGLSEVSSIFLVSIDMFKYFEPLPGTWFESYTLHWAKPLFAVTFFYYRVVLWWPVSKRLLDDVRSVTGAASSSSSSDEQAQQLRPGRNWILYMWLVLNFPMGLLQLYWLTTIIAKAHATISGQ